MNEASLFAYWLGQEERQSKLTLNEIACMTVVDITTKLDVPDLTAVLYYGNGTSALTALASLREKFEAELRNLESLTYPQEAEA